MHTYTKEDRIHQLNELEKALNDLIPIAAKSSIAKLREYEQAISEVKRLLKDGFTQKDLSLLSRSVPDVFDRHRDWESQYLEQKTDGTWYEPDWFIELEKVLQPTLEAAGVLRQLGYY